MPWLGYLGALLFLLLAGTNLQAQPGGVPKATPQQPTDGTRVRVIFSRQSQLLRDKENTYLKLVQDVELRQDSVFMYCDSAIIQNETLVFAYGNVVIQQGDSLQVFSQEAEYNGITKFAKLRGEVVLVNGTKQLYTQELDYDLNTRIATYFTGATLVNDSTQLSSQRGYYYVATQEAFFRDSVVVIDPGFRLRADTLKFNVETQVVTFLGPTLIATDSGRIFTEAGFYDTANGLAAFTKDPQYLQRDRKAVADTIRYDERQGLYILQGSARVEDSTRLAVADYIQYNERLDRTFLVGNARYQEGEQDIQAEEITYDSKKKTYATRGRSKISDPPQLLEADQVDFDDETGFGLAFGQVMWQDTAANLAINCDTLNYRKADDYLLALGGSRGRPELTTLVEGDTLFLTADTLIAFRPDTSGVDTSRVLVANHQVRIFKNNLQAVCDSLAYQTRDSIFALFKNPIVWSDTSQFVADTIFIRLRDDQIDRIFLRSNAFIVNISDSTYFNQIKGRTIEAQFIEGDLRRMDVQGNAEAIYYAKDDSGAYVGVNKTSCSEMLIYFGSNEVERIRFLQQPESRLSPMRGTDHEAMQLKGFRWITSGRPLGREPLVLVDQMKTGDSPPVNK